MQLDVNFTEIEKMLSLVQTYGFSHVCANAEFRNIDDVQSTDGAYNFNYPYLDIFLYTNKSRNDRLNIELYFRGIKNQELKFQNLFEYLLWTSSQRTGFCNCVSLIHYDIVFIILYDSIWKYSIMLFVSEKKLVNPNIV